MGEGGKAGEAVNTKPSYYLIQSIITLFSGVLGIGGGGVRRVRQLILNHLII